MSNFDDNVDLMGEWVPRSPRNNITSSIREDKNSNSNSNRVLERELSLNHGQVISLQDIRNKEKQSNTRGGLSERRAGFNAPRLNTENIRSTDFSIDSTVRSPCLTISSPGLSPATLLESPVFLSNPLAQPSPTTGKFQLLPGVNNNNGMGASVLEKPKDEFFDDIGLSSFSFHPISRPSSSFFQGGATNAKANLNNQHSYPGPEVVSLDYGNYNRSPHSMEDVKPGSQNLENQSHHTNFHETEGDLSGQRVSDATNISLEPVEPQEEEQRRGGGGCAADLLAGGAPAEDGYNWRKYGQKLVKGSEYPRSYYKCTQLNCLVKKKVERSREGHITEIIYKGAHNHSKPPPNRRSGIGSSGACLDTQVDGSEQSEQQGWNNGNQQAGSNENVEGASPVSTGFEYGNQSGSIQGQIGGQFEPGDAAFGSVSGVAGTVGGAGVVEESPTFSNDEDEDDRGTHGSVSLGYDGEVDESESKRRKLEAYASEMSGATRAIREPRVVVQTTSDVDILEDGYRWRKYGQKVVKGNPNPRSYYKCTAPGCTVRKHVERASHDLKSVITTYEGKHNHDVPAARNSGSAAGGNNNNGGGSVNQSHYNHHHSEPQRSRFERGVTATNHHSSSPYGPFSFQPHLGAPNFSFGLGQTGLGNLSMPGLGFGQGKLPVMPVHPYLTQQQQNQQQTQQGGIGENQGMMMQRGMEPKVEPVSETGIGLSSSSSIYKQLMSRLPHI